MKWRNSRESSNVDVGSGGGNRFGGPRLGLGGIVIVIIIGLILGKNPMQMLGMVTDMQGQGASTTQSQPAEGNAPQTEQQEFSSRVLASTEDVWTDIFQQSNQQYAAPHMTLFTGSVQTACGGASSAVGPFYCPADQRVYLDTDFFRDMQEKLGGGGDFAQAYVIAHEVGHHIQNLMGVSAQVAKLREQGQAIEGESGASVRQELQADCLAGVWAVHSNKKLNWLEQGDLETAIRTAQAIGDDQLQRQSRGTVVPDSFTHGSSEQRVRWFKQGFETGNMQSCDTFKASRL